MKMIELIDKENGEGFHKNIDLSGYNFFKGNSFISFKISKVEGVNIANIRYIYSDKKEDLLKVLAYCCNFWVGNKVKFIYYKEKDKAKYATKALNNLGFKIVDDVNNIQWKHSFNCNIHNNGECNCKINEAYV